MSQAALADIVLAIRQAVGDDGSSVECTVRDERLEGVDGVNKRFTVLRFPINSTTGAPFQLRQSHNGTVSLLTITTDYTIDTDLGVVTMTTAPALGDPTDPAKPIDVLFATYRFFWYKDDSNYYEFLIQACRNCGVFPTATLTTPAARAADVLLKLDDNLIDAVILLAAAAFNLRRATEWASRVDSSSGGQDVKPSSPSKAYADLAKKFGDRGIEMRDDVYKRRGKRNAPAAGLGRYRGLNVPYQPPR